MKDMNRWNGSGVHLCMLSIVSLLNVGVAHREYYQGTMLCGD
jgi:hypothetical protein